MMSKSTVITMNLVGLLICAGFFSGHCWAYEDEGFQFWATASASFDNGKKWKGKFAQEFRLGDDGGHLYYEHSDLGFTYTGVANWIDVGFNYRQIFEKDGGGEWWQENRPHFNITLKMQLFDLDLSDRSRFEYRDRENKDDLWRYRNKITVKFPLELTPLKLQPYIADDVFINFDKEDFNKNWFYSGLSLKVSERLKGEVYYLWQSSESGGEWKDVDVLGLQMKFYF